MTVGNLAHSLGLCNSRRSVDVLDRRDSDSLVVSLTRQAFFACQRGAQESSHVGALRLCRVSTAKFSSPASTPMCYTGDAARTAPSCRRPLLPFRYGTAVERRPSSGVHVVVHPAFPNSMSEAVAGGRRCARCQWPFQLEYPTAVSRTQVKCA